MTREANYAASILKTEPSSSGSRCREAFTLPGLNPMAQIASSAVEEQLER
jgi:hypothetical protein